MVDASDRAGRRQDQKVRAAEVQLPFAPQSQRSAFEVGETGHRRLRSGLPVDPQGHRVAVLGRWPAEHQEAILGCDGDRVAVTVEEVTDIVSQRPEQR